VVNNVGPLLQHLPAIYHSSETLRDFLAAFEAVLFGSEGLEHPEIEGLETKIAKVPIHFDAFRTPQAFLPWLAQWVALAHGRGLPEERLRILIARSVPLYALRGTKAYVEELLKLFLPDIVSVSVDDQETTPVVVGLSRVGVDSWLGGDRPFWFRVVISVDVEVTPGEESNQPGPGLESSARSVIELAKPAYTTFELEWRLGGLSEGDRLRREGVFA
jgi:phage tail-like protein